MIAFFRFWPKNWWRLERRTSFGVVHWGQVRKSCLQRMLNPLSDAGVTLEVVVLKDSVCAGPVTLACVAFVCCVYFIDIPMSKHDVMERKHSSHMSLSSTTS